MSARKGPTNASAQSLWPITADRDALKTRPELRATDKVISFIPRVVRSMAVLVDGGSKVM